MSKPIIAVDIDGVLADWVGSAVPRLNKILNTDLNIGDDISFNLHTAFGVSPKIMDEALDELYKNFSLSDCRPIDGSKEAIKILSKDFDFIAITARHKDAWKDTYEWVKTHYDNLIEVYFGTAQGRPFGGDDHEENKLTLCERFNAKYLVEDNPAEILAALKTKTIPLCHAWPWNTELASNKKIIRGNWDYLTKHILENSK